MTEESAFNFDPAISAMMRAARDFLRHDHSLFGSLELQPKLLERGQTIFTATLPQQFGDNDGAVHGGLFTIILDSLMGLTVYTALEELTPIATVNLRVDLIGQALCGSNVLCTCDFLTIVDEVAYVDGRLAAEEGGALIAAGSGAFIVGARGRTKESRL